MLLKFVPMEYRQRSQRAKRKAPPPPAPPAALNLVAAWYVALPYPSNRLRLQFDRAIDVSGFDGSQIVVKVGSEFARYLANGAVEVVDPATIDIALVSPQYFEGGNTLTAPATTGIVAVDDGGTWAGVNEMPLPNLE